jgi:hypothetical protein
LTYDQSADSDDQEDPMAGSDQEQGSEKPPPGAASTSAAATALYAHGTGALPPGVEGGLDAQTVYAD